SIDLLIATRVTTVRDGVVRYRDTDLLDLVAADTPFEAVAELLWSGPPAPDAPPAPAGRWSLSAGRAAAVARVVEALDGTLPAARRFAAVVAAAGPPEPA